MSFFTIEMGFKPDYSNPTWGFVPNSILHDKPAASSDAALPKVTPAIYTRVTIPSYERKEKEEIEAVQLRIHEFSLQQMAAGNVVCSRRSISTYDPYVVQAQYSKSLLQGILKVRLASKVILSQYNEYFRCSLNKESFSKTIHYMEEKQFLTKEETDEFYKELDVSPPVYNITTSIGYTDAYQPGMWGFVTSGSLEENLPSPDFSKSYLTSAIFFTIHFSNGYRFKPYESERELGRVGDYITDLTRKEIPGNIATCWEGSTKEQAWYIGPKHAKAFLTAVLKATGEWTKNFNPENKNKIDEESFEKTLKVFSEKKLISQEDLKTFAESFKVKV